MMKVFNDAITQKSKRLRALVCIAVAVAMLLSINVLAPAKTQAASKKTVYVISKITQKGTYSSSASTVSYNKRGLLGKLTNYHSGKKYGYVVFKYDAKKKSKLKRTYDIPLEKYGTDTFGGYTNYSYTSSGAVKAIKDDFAKYNVTKRKNGYAKVLSGVGRTDKRYISYDKKHHITKVSGNIGEMTFKYSYSYDKKGNMKKGPGVVYKNTYKNNRLVKTKVYLNGEYNTTIKYTYKKIKIPSKYVKRVKKQQWGLRNQVDMVGWLPMVQ